MKSAAQTIINGTETEFGVLAIDPKKDECTDASIGAAINSSLHWLSHPRVFWSENEPSYIDYERLTVPSRNGGCFLRDRDHLEYASPETFSALGAVKSQIGGYRELLDKTRNLRFQFFNDNRDGERATYGAHESYCLPRSAKEFIVASPLVGMFLAARQVLCSSGFFSPDGTPKISQRADFFTQVSNEDSTGAQQGRGIINLRDESLSDSNRFFRFHVICGEGNVLRFALMKKILITQLFLRGMIDGEFNELQDAVKYKTTGFLPIDFRTIGSQPGAWKFLGTSHTHFSQVLNFLSEVLKISRDAYFKTLDASEQFVFTKTEREVELLRQLPRDWHAFPKVSWPIIAELRTTNDWVNKISLIQQLSQEMGQMSNEGKASLSMDYHNINPDLGFFSDELRTGILNDFLDDSALNKAMQNAPEPTRAKFRSYVVNQAVEGTGKAYIDWPQVSFAPDEYPNLQFRVSMEDPNIEYGAKRLPNAKTSNKQQARLILR